MERRVSAAGLTMATTLAHVWFNAYFEGGHEHDSGVFEVDWEEMDGIKGTGNKGLLKGFDRVSVVWRYVGEEGKEDKEGSEGEGEGDGDGKGKGKGEISSAAIGEEEADKIKEDAGRSEVEQVVREPAPGEEVPETKPADWRGDEDQGEKGLYVKMKHTASE
ncbi:Telomerase protein component 1 [Ascosphaera atra]|nr:Telomerase protein component 1 [Ascosphaera atra]